MAMQAWSKSANLIFSFQARIPTPLLVSTVDAAGDPLDLEIPVYFDTSWDDPEDLQSGGELPDRAFVGLRWREEEAGDGRWHVVQVDVMVRIGAKTDPYRDPFGRQARDIADAFAELWRGREPGNDQMRWCIDIDDYADPANPVATGVCAEVFARDTPGGYGLANERISLLLEEGYRRITMVFTIRLKRTGIPAFIFEETT